MMHPNDLPEQYKRRSFVGLVGASLLGLGVELPRAHDRATLAADVTPTGYTVGKFGDVYGLTYRLKNHAGEPVWPVPTVWGVGRRTQHPWSIEQGALPLPAGETATYQCWAPGHHEAVRAPTDKKSQLTVYDKGREARAIAYFTAERDLTRHGRVDA